jgi:hypothetical protein
VKQADGDQRQTPGYFWLAYRWDNLLLTCFRCNTNRKRDLFPLRFPDRRARDPNENDDAAGPLLINPCTEDPREHIRYRDVVAYSVNNSTKGTATRNLFALNTDRMLIGHRREYLAFFRNTVILAETNDDREIQSKAESLVARLLSGRGQYLAMITDAFRAMITEGTVARLAYLLPP